MPQRIDRVGPIQYAVLCVLAESWPDWTSTMDIVDHVPNLAGRFQVRMVMSALLDKGMVECHSLMVFDHSWTEAEFVVTQAGMDAQLRKGQWERVREIGQACPWRMVAPGCVRAPFHTGFHRLSSGEKFHDDGSPVVGLPTLRVISSQGAVTHETA